MAIASSLRLLSLKSILLRIARGFQFNPDPWLRGPDAAGYTPCKETLIDADVAHGPRPVASLSDLRTTAGRIILQFMDRPNQEGRPNRLIGKQPCVSRAAGRIQAHSRGRMEAPGIEAAELSGCLLGAPDAPVSFIQDQLGCVENLSFVKFKVRQGLQQSSHHRHIGLLNPPG